jgi:hypothetical protein
MLAFAVAITLMLLSSSVPAHAKCVPLAVEVKVRVQTLTSEAWDLAVYSRPEGTAKPAIVNRETGDATVTLWFDSYSGSSWWRGDKCSRKPNEVGLRLLVGSVERANVVLLFPEHFEHSGPAHWVSKRTVLLTLGHDTESTQSKGPHNKALQLTRSARGPMSRGPRS